MPADCWSFLRTTTVRGKSVPLASRRLPDCHPGHSRNLGSQVSPGVIPFASDILLTLPFLIDTAGNALDLYDAVQWWDDANHLVNWALLSGALRRSPALSERWLAGAVSGLGKRWRSWWDSERSLPSCGSSRSILPSSGARRSWQPPTPIRLATWRWALPGRCWLAWQLLCRRAGLSRGTCNVTIS